MIKDAACVRVDTLQYGAASPQTGRQDEAISEGCLFLNVWTPGVRDGAKRQTMVFDVQSRLVDDPRGHERELFAKVPWVQQGT